MAKLLLVYGSGEGQTTKIATRLAQMLGHHHQVTLSRGADNPDPGAFDMVVIGASIHGGRYQHHIRSYVRRHRNQLAARPGAFFSVCLTAAEVGDDSLRTVSSYLERFLHDTRWRPELIASFAGAIRYSRYGPIKTQLVKRVAADLPGGTDTRLDREFTDWNAVESFAERVLRRLEAGEPKAAAVDLAAGSQAPA